MPLTTHHVWHVRIHSPGPNSVKECIHSFQDSGFTVRSLQYTDTGRPWMYSVQHSRRNAMTLHMLKVDANSFTVLAEWSNA
jgi:hypothetical protein